MKYFDSTFALYVVFLRSMVIFVVFRGHCLQTIFHLRFFKQKKEADHVF